MLTGLAQKRFFMIIQRALGLFLFRIAPVGLRLIHKVLHTPIHFFNFFVCSRSKSKRRSSVNTYESSVVSSVMTSLAHHPLARLNNTLLELFEMQMSPPNNVTA
jgi:hypothetical protein